MKEEEDAADLAVVFDPGGAVPDDGDERRRAEAEGEARGREREREGAGDREREREAGQGAAPSLCPRAQCGAAGWFGGDELARARSLQREPLQEEDEGILRITPGIISCFYSSQGSSLSDLFGALRQLIKI